MVVFLKIERYCVRFPRSIGAFGVSVRGASILVLLVPENLQMLAEIIQVSFLYTVSNLSIICNRKDSFRLQIKLHVYSTTCILLDLNV